MRDLIFIVIILAIVIGLIYLIFNLISFVSFKDSKEDLQISMEDILAQISILYRQKKFNIVEYLAKRYLAKRPRTHEIRYILAKTYFKTKRVPEAIEQAKIIEKFDGINIENKIFLVKCYKQQNRPLVAIDVIKEILKYEPANLYALNEIAGLYKETGQKLSAIRAYRQVEEFYKASRDVIAIKNSVAELYSELGQYFNAISEYKQILLQFPDEIEVKRKLVLEYIKNLQFTYALTTLNELEPFMKTDEETLWYLDGLVNIKTTLKDYEGAFEDVKKLVEHPLADKSRVKAQLAKIMIKVGKIDESIELINQLLEADAHNIELKKILAQSFAAKKDFMSSINIYKRILNEAPIEEIENLHKEISDMYTDWAEDYFTEKNIPKCFETFTLAFQYDSENPEAYYKLSKINLAIKSYNEAVVNCRKAIELNPTNPNYYLVLAKCYSYLNNALDERKALMNAIEYNYNNPAAHYRLAIINELQRDLAGAVSHMKIAIELDENFIEAKYKLALLLELQGNVEEAIEVYEDILIQDPAHELAIKNLEMLKKL